MDRGGVKSSSAQETISLGRTLGQSLKPGDIVCLFGDLGAGKTTLIKGIISALSSTSCESVCSPTFSYLQIYEGKCPLYHFDLYRLKNVEEFLDLGFEEYLFSPGISFVEWSERIETLLPQNVLRVRLCHLGEDTRSIHYEISKC